MGSRFQRDSRALGTVGCYVHHVVCIGVVNVGVNTPDSIQTENIRANPSFSANRGKETICKLHLVLPQKHVGNALLDNVLPSAVRTHQFSANHVQLQERVMDLMQHLVRQLGGIAPGSGSPIYASLSAAAPTSVAPTGRRSSRSSSAYSERSPC